MMSSGIPGRRAMPVIGSMTGISFWKRARMGRFLGRSTAFARTARAAVRQAQIRGGGIAVWPSRAPAGLEALAAAAGVKVYRVEDGFIRSAGLGADFIAPASIVLDGAGIYYDPSRPSDLEVLLAAHDFSPALLARARRLIETLTARGVTKYNLAAHHAVLPASLAGLRVLVPGQVADDRSVQLGGAGIAPGLDLLARVRAAAPNAFIAYKPHPDVEAGHRRGYLPDRKILHHADVVLHDTGITEAIGWADEIHTLTSLTGFEALLRCKPVHTYGQPFYAGWGLTVDHNAPPARRRRLRLEELVAATLILYPYYLDPVTHTPCEPEQLIARLQTATPSVSALVALRRLQGRIRRALSQR